MSKLEKISILMAAYNAEKTIKSAVESVQVQTSPLAPLHCGEGKNVETSYYGVLDGASQTSQPSAAPLPQGSLDKSRQSRVAPKLGEMALEESQRGLEFNFELIVVNDCSRDKTAEIVSDIAAKDPRVKLISNETNLGVSLTRKKALDAATGDWIAVLDSDDMWTSDKLEKQLAFAEKTGADLVFTASAFMDNDGNPIDWQLHVPSEMKYRELLKQNIISNSSVLVKRELYEKFYVVGDYMHNDFAMWLSIIKAGHKVLGLNEPLLTYRVSGTSKTGNKIKSAKMTWNTYRYIGLNLIEAMYFMCWYAVRGILKYRKLR